MTYLDFSDPDTWAHTVKAPHKVVYCMKEQQRNAICQVFIIIVDFACSPYVTQNRTVLRQSYTCGRHQMIFPITATSAFKARSPIARQHTIELHIYRLRHHAAFDPIIEEVIPIYDKKTLYQWYRMATDEPYSSVYITLASRYINVMFYVRCEWPLIPNGMGYVFTLVLYTTCKTS